MLASDAGPGEHGPSHEERIDTLCECRDCGLIQLLPHVPEGSLSSCHRCDGTLHKSARHTLQLSLACSSIGLFLLALALWLPSANVLMPGGRSATSDLLSGPELLRQAGSWELAIVVVLTLLVLPAFELLAILAMAVAVWRKSVPGWTRWCFAALPVLSSWAMVEVFMLGAAISLVRLRAWMTVELGPALFALAGVALCSMGIARALDRRALWQRVPWSAALPPRSAGSVLISCGGCELVGAFAEGSRCPRCVHVLHARKPHSASRTWALLCTAAVLAIPANVLPVMTILQTGIGGASTIMGGTIELVQHGFWLLALLVFVASIMVPVFKLVALSILLVSTSRGSTERLLIRTKVFRLISFIGRWSMLDIFATMTLVELARFGWLGSVRPGAGATAFCSVVVVTMLASEAFDPRLMWDAAGENHRLEVHAPAGGRAA
jgi:paraquat-inducible protein A